MLNYPCVVLQDAYRTESSTGNGEGSSADRLAQVMRISCRLPIHLFFFSCHRSYLHTWKYMSFCCYRLREKMTLTQIIWPMR